LALEALARLTGRADLPSAQDSFLSRDMARRQLESSAIPVPPVAGWPFTADGVLDRPHLAEWMHERREAEVSVGE
jgi:hypothetical protein